MPKSFLITNKRYKGEVPIQRSPESLVPSLEPCVIHAPEPSECFPDDLVRVPTPAGDTTSEDSGTSSGKENEIDVEEISELPLLDKSRITCWSDEIPRDCIPHQCNVITDLTSSPRRSSETPDSGSDYGSEPVDFSLKGRPSPPFDATPPYYPTLFSSVIDDRLPVNHQSAFKLHSSYDVPSDIVYSTDLRQLDYSLNALVEKAWSEISVGDNHICPECGKRYSTSSNLARHRQTHRSVSDKKARKCPHCEKVYVSMPAYSMHVRTHNQGCECRFCGKRFSRPWLLQGHIRTHTGEKPFKCPQCGKAFADKSNLRAHVQTHSSDKPYACARCGKAFALKSYLYKHEESSCMRGQHQRLSQQFQDHATDMVLAPALTVL